MKSIALLFLVGLSLSHFSFADPLKGQNIGVQIDTTNTVPANPELKNLKKPVGHCDGKDFYSHSALDGCLKNYNSRSTAPMQTQTQDNSNNIAVPANSAAGDK